MEEKETQLKENQDVLLDKYLEKKNRNRNITIIFILAISLILIGFILFVSLFKVSVRPPFLSEQQPINFAVTYGGSNKTYERGSTEYESLDEQLEDMFSMPYLTAIFEGQTGNYKIEETYDRFQKGNLSTYLGTSNYINVYFNDKKVVKNGNGKDYLSTHIASSAQDRTVDFQEYYVALPEGNKFQNITIVIPVYGNYLPTNSNTYDDTIATVTKITIRANANGLNVSKT